MMKRILAGIRQFLSVNGKRDWCDGHPPQHVPRSYITEGMRLDKNDPKKVIPTWRYNEQYYGSLL